LQYADRDRLYSFIKSFVGDTVIVYLFKPLLTLLWYCKCYKDVSFYIDTSSKTKKNTNFIQNN